MAATVIGAFAMVIIAVLTTLLVTKQIMLPEVGQWSSFSYTLPGLNRRDWKAPWVRTLTETNTLTVTQTFLPQSSFEPSGLSIAATAPVPRQHIVPPPTSIAKPHSMQNNPTVDRSLRRNVLR